jgi:hypothetical protein
VNVPTITAAGPTTTAKIPTPVQELATQAPATEDPNAGQPLTSLTFTRTGGADNSSLTIQINGDGTLVRDGQSMTLKPEDITALTQLIDKMNFFGMPGTLLGPASSPAIYRYSITVERAGNSRTISTQDGSMSDDIKALIGKILSLGVPSGPGAFPASAATATP